MFPFPQTRLYNVQTDKFTLFDRTAIEQDVCMQCSFTCHSAVLYYTRIFTYTLVCKSGCILRQLRSVLSVYTWIDTLVSDRMRNTISL